jgi:lipoate-protein ligase A
MEKTLFDELTEVEDVTAEQILNQLLSKKKKKFHTEINNPFATTTLDVLCEYYKDIGIGKLLKAFLDNFRDNMVSYKRKRATEIVEAFKYHKLIEERQKLEQKLLGGI